MLFYSDVSEDLNPINWRVSCGFREDLDAMEEAVVEAKSAGVSEAAAYMVESSILKDRGEKQLEAQTMLTQALASLSKSKMRGAGDI